MEQIDIEWNNIYRVYRYALDKLREVIGDTKKTSSFRSMTALVFELFAVV